MTLPPTNPMLPQEPLGLTITSRPGILDFIWPESAIRPTGTRYRLRESNVNSFAVGSYAWDGDATRAQLLPFDTSTRFYWVEAYTDPNSGSIYPGVSSGIPYGALPLVDRREAGNVGVGTYVLGDYAGLAVNSYFFGISGVEYETDAPADVRVTFTARARTNAAGFAYPALALHVQSGYPANVTTPFTFLARQTVSSYFTDITMTGLAQVASGGYRFWFGIGPTDVAAPTSSTIEFTEWRLLLEATKRRG